MKKNAQVFSLLALLIMLSFSCKKNNQPTRSELLAGTWTTIAFGQDANMNGTLEVAEYTAIPTGSSLVEIFKSDHTGTAIVTSGGVTTQNTFTWQFQNNEQQLAIVATGTNTTSIAQVSLLNSNQLMLYDVTSNPRLIYLFSR